MGRIRDFLGKFARTGGSKSNDMRNSAIVRASNSLGPFDATLGAFCVRDVNPWFYEAMRESLAPLDGGIGRLVTLDGIVRVTGGNDRITQLLENELLAAIPVNDLEAGFQAFYSSQSNELYEQGLGIGEMVMDDRGRELVGLRVADSKGIYFKRESGQLQTWYRAPQANQFTRRDGSDNIETILRNRQMSATSGLLIGASYAPLDSRQLVYAVNAPEADKPYGVSLLRSLEFVTQIILRMQNATSQTWDRFGDPSFQVTYKTKNRGLQSVDLDKRRQTIAADFAAALTAKRKGNSIDFVQAIGADDALDIKVIGADGQVLEMEIPARHMLEMVVSKFNLPGWMLGFQWSTSERLAEQQSVVVLQESKTRFARRKPGLMRVAATFLRGRGLSWKPGDWDLVQELPNLHDELKRAQSEFLHAQTVLMLRGDASALEPPPGTDQGAAKRWRERVMKLTAEGSFKWPALESAEPIIVTEQQMRNVREAIEHAADPVDMALRLSTVLAVQP